MNLREQLLEEQKSSEESVLNLPDKLINKSFTFWIF